MAKFSLTGDSTVIEQMTKGWSDQGSTADDDSDAPVTVDVAKAIREDIGSLTGSFLKQRRHLLIETIRNRELEARIDELTGSEPDSEAEALMAKREALMAAPAISVEFNRARLRDVLRFLADEAGVPYVLFEPSLGIDSEVFVTFKMEASPFSMLETVANTHGFALNKEGDAWALTELGGINTVEQQLQWVEGFLQTVALSESFNRERTLESVNSLTGSAGNSTGSTMSRLIDDYRRLHPGTDLANFVPADFLFKANTTGPE